MTKPGQYFGAFFRLSRCFFTSGSVAAFSFGARSAPVILFDQNGSSSLFTAVVHSTKVVDFGKGTMLFGPWVTTFFDAGGSLGSSQAGLLTTDSRAGAKPWLASSVDVSLLVMYLKSCQAASGALVVRNRNQPLPPPKMRRSPWSFGPRGEAVTSQPNALICR